MWKEEDIALLKVFVYKMHAGVLGTDTAFTVVGKEPLTSEEEDEYVYYHATSYQEQDEDGEWPEGDPCIWLAATCTTKEELKKCSGYLLSGGDTFEGLIADLEKEGMKFYD